MLVSRAVFLLLLLLASVWSTFLFHNPNQEGKGPRTNRGTRTYFARVDNNNDLFCGGALVAHDVVVSAAHCYTPNLSVVVNGYDESEVGSLRQDQRGRTVEKVIQHHNYSTIQRTSKMTLCLSNFKAQSKTSPVSIIFGGISMLPSQVQGRT
jgi:hypothetical protein